MRFGVHLPQYGHASGPEAITRAAQQAEGLGFDDVWVYDHIAIPADTSYPVAYSYDALLALTWAGAGTRSVGLGTSILVLPYRHPVMLAKSLGSLDRLSGGRLILGVGCGWLEAEFEALGLDFGQRGASTDEAIDFLRACWSSPGPVSFRSNRIDVRDMRILPRPERPVPIWVGGQSEAALRRAVTRGDGWHGAFIGVADAVDYARRLRRDRPEPGFTLSLRMEWDGLSIPPDQLRRDVAELHGAGFDHLMAAPSQRDIDSWCRSVEALWEVFRDFSG